MEKTVFRARYLAIASGATTLLALFAFFPWLITSAFSSSYLPHGFCFLWDPRLLWLHVIADSAIWLSYTAIALTLSALVYTARKEIPFQGIFLAFGTFIIACGFTHFMEIVVLWKPLYWLGGDIKLVTAAASLITAVALPFYLPLVRGMLRDAAVSTENARRFLASTNSALDSFYILSSVRDGAGEITDFRFSFANPRGAKLLRREPHELLGKLLCELIPRNRTDGFFAKYKRVVETGEALIDEFPIDFEDVDASWLKYQVVRLEDGVALTVSDISERKRMEAERDRVFAQSLIQSSPAAVILADAQHWITAINPATEKMLGYGPEEVVGKVTPLHFYSAPEVEKRAEEMALKTGLPVSWEEAIFAGLGDATPAGEEWTFLRKDGSPVTVEVTVTPLQSVMAPSSAFMITAYDVSERKRREEYISHLAQHDVLTGLPTRKFLMERLSMMLAHSSQMGTRSALLMIDLNNFKGVNDSLGHQAGDLLLVQVAQRLRESVRASDVVARMGGDEFVVLISDLISESAAEVVAEKLLQSFRRPFAIREVDTGMLAEEQVELEMTASLGICVYPEGGADAASMLRNADVAMYQAKASGRNRFELYSSEIAGLVRQKQDMERALVEGLVGGEFVLHYQPQFSLTDGTMVGVEALLRWNSRTLGQVEPSRFIALAEQSGLIVPIGEWVIQNACRELRRLQSQYLRTLVMAVNFSARQLDQADLLQVIERALAENNLDPACLEVEITESVLISDSPRVAAFFDGLRKLGVRVAIDDFGTGFSSMAYLLRFPVDRLKIDRCFIQDCSTNPNSATVTTAIIALAHQLKLSVLAEGVETQEQLEFLKEAGCDDVQGFFLCRPVPAEAVFGAAATSSS